MVVFEPSYEAADDEGRRRMDDLGYVRDLAGAIDAASGELVASHVISRPLNPQNPTVAHLVRPRRAPVAAPRPRPARSPEHQVGWSCPISRTPLRAVAHEEGGWLWSEEAFLLYPVVGGIPLLTEGSAVFASRGREGSSPPRR